MNMTVAAEWLCLHHGRAQRPSGRIDEEVWLDLTMAASHWRTAYMADLGKAGATVYASQTALRSACASQQISHNIIARSNIRTGAIDTACEHIHIAFVAAHSRRPVASSTSSSLVLSATDGDTVPAPADFATRPTD